MHVLDSSGGVLFGFGLTVLFSSWADRALWMGIGAAATLGACSVVGGIVLRLWKTRPPR